MFKQQNDGLSWDQFGSFVVTLVDTVLGIIVRKVLFMCSNNMVLVGNLFLPKGFDKSRRYPAMLSVYPARSVKEQAAGLYVWRMVVNGF